MYVVPICLLALLLLVNAIWAFWRGADDQKWETRWEGLDDLDRAWLAAASRSSANRDTLVERGEFELAKGFGRREQRRRAYIMLAMLPLLLVPAVLILTGLVSDSLATAFLWSFLFLQNIVATLRSRKIKNRYQEVRDRYLAAPNPEAAL
ncbi:MAG TPA: hypothetical protein VGI17_08735 [Solirubrobacterales bacterium]